MSAEILVLLPVESMLTVPISWPPNGSPFLFSYCSNDISLWCRNRSSYEGNCLGFLHMNIEW